MKKFLIVFFAIWISMLFFGCKQAENSSIDTALKANYKQKITYNIEQIYFLKSFQSLSPNVEIIGNGGQKKLLANLGLSDYSEISIDNILLKNDEVNIYISGYRDSSQEDLSVPQIILDFSDNTSFDIEDLKFNLIYNDYDYLDIKFNINDILNKLESTFKLASNSYPKFNLIKSNDEIIWEITYENIISRESPDYPLINFKVQVNANSGQVLDHQQEDLASIVDMGNILTFQENGGFIYERKSCLEGDSNKLELWFYNTLSGEKKPIYSSYYSILSPKISSNLEHMAFIERTENSSETYVFSNDDSKIYKLYFESEFNPQLLQWKTDTLLYLLETREDKSIIYSYDLESNELKMIIKSNKHIDSFVASKEGFIVSEEMDKSSNKILSFTEDFKRYKTINSGFNPKFINENTVIYLKNNEKTDMNYLIVYDLENEKIISKLEDDILDYRIISNDSLLYVKNNPKYKDFTLSSYSLDLKSSLDIINIVDKKVYYNSHKNLIYLNVTLPFENSNIIYSIDLD